MKDQLVQEYRDKHHVFEGFKDSMQILIRNLLKKSNLQVHQISSRAKEFDSLTKKIEDKGEKYTNLSDITDLVGIRIITYLESDVNQIAELLEQEFLKDEPNSIDKRILKADQFGYRSLHLVAELADNRNSLSEYSSYAGLKFEIQIRSILQHAWAEIEHDLGYKSENVPEPVKRTFNRLAALLETGDLEFDRLKKELNSYEKEVPKLVEKEPENVDVNRVSWSALLNTNYILQKVSNHLRHRNVKMMQPPDPNILTNSLKQHGFITIKDIEDFLEVNKSFYIRYAIKFIDLRNLKGNFHDTFALNTVVVVKLLVEKGIESTISQINLKGENREERIFAIREAYSHAIKAN